MFVSFASVILLFPVHLNSQNLLLADEFNTRLSSCECVIGFCTLIQIIYFNVCMQFTAEETKLLVVSPFTIVNNSTFHYFKEIASHNGVNCLKGIVAPSSLVQCGRPHTSFALLCNTWCHSFTARTALLKDKPKILKSQQTVLY